MGNIFEENVANAVVQQLEQEVKELKEKHNEEMILMKNNQEKILSQLSVMTQFMSKFFQAELSMPQIINESSSREVTDANSGHKRAPKAPQMSFQSHGIDRNFIASRGDSSSKDGFDSSRKRTTEKVLDSRAAAKRTNNQINSRQGGR